MSYRLVCIALENPTPKQLAFFAELCVKCGASDMVTLPETGMNPADSLRQIYVKNGFAVREVEAVINSVTLTEREANNGKENPKA